MFNNCLFSLYYKIIEYNCFCQRFVLLGKFFRVYYASCNDKFNNFISFRVFAFENLQREQFFILFGE